MHPRNCLQTLQPLGCRCIVFLQCEGSLIMRNDTETSVIPAFLTKAYYNCIWICMPSTLKIFFGHWWEAFRGVHANPCQVRSTQLSHSPMYIAQSSNRLKLIGTEWRKHTEYMYIYIYVNRRLEPTIFGNFPTINVQTLYMYLSIHIYIYIFISIYLKISIYLYIYISIVHLPQPAMSVLSS